MSSVHQSHICDTAQTAYLHPPQCKTNANVVTGTAMPAPTDVKLHMEDKV